jgi:uncharacterized protein YceK
MTRKVHPALIVAATLAASPSFAASLSRVYAFPPNNNNGEAVNGALPTTGLTPDPAGSGALYGTASRGGNYDVNGYGGGVVFKLTPPAAGHTVWTQKVLHAFTGYDDGIFPAINGNVIVVAGDVYGTTVGDAEFGGPICGTSQNLSCDTVFQLKPPAAGHTVWTDTVLYRFPGGKEGYEPTGGLTAGPGGSLYGTTAAGGNTGCQNSYTNGYLSVGCGTIFQLTPPAKSGGAWTHTILHTFSGGSDGGIPLAALLPDPAGSGALYGTASTGGTTACAIYTQDCGVVFKLTPPAAGHTVWTETILYSFKGGGDGYAPYSTLVTRGGVLYGTTQSGGFSCNIYGCGTVFSLTPPAAGHTVWTFKTLYQFKGGDYGGGPQAGLALDSTGALYGTTYQYGDSNINLDCGRFVGCGTVFKLTPPAKSGAAWTPSIVYHFNGTADGGQSSAPLAFSGGALYGTTILGGSSACPATIAPNCGGVVFKVTP